MLTRGVDRLRYRKHSLASGEKHQDAGGRRVQIAKGKPEHIEYRDTSALPMTSR